MKRIIKSFGFDSCRVEVYKCNFRTRRVEMRLYDSSSPLFVFCKTFYCCCSRSDLERVFLIDTGNDFIRFMRCESSDVYMMRSQLPRPLFFKRDGKPTTRYYEL